MTRLKSIEGDGAVVLKGANWAEMMADLTAQLEQSDGHALDRGMHVGLEATDSLPSAGELEQLTWLLEVHDVKLEWWRQVDARVQRRPRSTTRASDSVTTDRTYISGAGGETAAPTPSGKPDGKLWSEAALVSRTLRSGQYVRYAGTVVVMGDVNPGAVIIADGNIIVWGRLRGVVHAGAGGDEQAVVGALQLEPAQLRIGWLVARGQDIGQVPTMHAELARAREGQIVVEPWNDEKL